MAVFLGCTSTGLVGLCFLWFYVQELPKAQPAVVLVLKRPRNFFVCGRVPWLYQYCPGGLMLFVVLCPGTAEGSTGSGSGFKASQKTGNGLSLILQTEFIFCGRVPWLYQYWPGGFFAFCGSLSRNSQRLNWQCFWF